MQHGGFGVQRSGGMGLAMYLGDAEMAVKWNMCIVTAYMHGHTWSSHQLIPCFHVFDASQAELDLQLWRGRTVM